jgi:hypothetical protein
MKRVLLLKAIEEYHAGVKNNPENYKDMLEYKGQ